MNLPELIENIWLDRTNLSTTAVNQAISKNYSDQELCAFTSQFLQGIDRQHSINGHIINTLWGICDYYREHRSITPRQRVYLIQNVIDHWDQLSCESRATLNL